MLIPSSRSLFAIVGSSTKLANTFTYIAPPRRPVKNIFATWIKEDGGRWRWMEEEEEEGARKRISCKSSLKHVTYSCNGYSRVTQTYANVCSDSSLPRPLSRRMWVLLPRKHERVDGRMCRLCRGQAQLPKLHVSLPVCRVFGSLSCSSSPPTRIQPPVVLYDVSPLALSSLLMRTCVQG